MQVIESENSSWLLCSLIALLLSDAASISHILDNSLLHRKETIPSFLVAVQIQQSYMSLFISLVRGLYSILPSGTYAQLMDECYKLWHS